VLAFLVKKPETIVVMPEENSQIQIVDLDAQ